MERAAISVVVVAALMLFAIYAQRQEPERFARARPAVVATLLVLGLLILGYAYLQPR